MKVYYKAKVFTLVSSVDVLAENSDEVLYKIRGKFFSFTAKKKITDAQDNLIYIVRDKFWHLFHKRAFILGPDKKKIACVTRKLFTFHENFYIDGFNQEIKVDGDLLGFKFKIYVDQELIAEVKFASLLKREIDVKDEEDLPFVIAIVTAIYNVINHKNRE